MKTYRNFLNGGCLDVKIVIGFRNLEPPHTLTSLRRSLGDFLDYSVHPKDVLEIDNIKSPDYLDKDSFLSIKYVN